MKPVYPQSEQSLILIHRIVRGIMHYHFFEDRLEYTLDDLRDAYSLPKPLNERLHQVLHSIASEPKFRWRMINGSFIESLWAFAKDSTFTTNEAEGVYEIHHWKSWHNYTPEEKKIHSIDCWGAATARNTLYNAVILGLLTRVSRGVYTFRL